MPRHRPLKNKCLAAVDKDNKLERVKKSTPLPALPHEVLVFIAEHVEGVPQQIMLRSTSKALSWGASKQLFKNLVKQATPNGIQDLRELADSKYRLLIKSLTLKAPENDSDLFPDYVVTPSFSDSIGAMMQKFDRLHEFGVSLDHRFGAMRNVQDETQAIMETIISAAAPSDTSVKRQFTLSGRGHFDIEEFNLWGTLEEHQRYIAQFSEVKLDFHLCSCYREGVLLSEHINLCHRLEELEITESSNSWITFEPSFTNDPPRYELPALKVLRLSNVLCTSSSLVAFLESSKSTLTSVTISSIKLASIQPDQSLGPTVPNNTLIESSWVDVFNFLQSCPNLTHFDYRMLQNYARHSHGHWHYHWHATASDWQGDWQMPLKRIMNAGNFDHAALGALLTTVQANALKAGVRVKLDAQDKKYMKQAKLADAPRRETRSRTAAARARQSVDG